MVRTSSHVAAAVLVLLAVSGCSSTLDIKDCREDFVEFPIDARVAREAIPSNLEPRIGAQGRATLLMMVQDCAEARLDGILAIRPMRMTHLWIEIAGPPEVGVALPGTEASLPTAYYYALPHQIDDGVAQAALGVAGFSIKAVKNIELGVLTNGTRKGEVIEDGDGARYAWHETAEVWPQAKVLTGRRRFLSQYGTLVPRNSDGIVVCNSRFLGHGHVELEASATSTLAILLHESTFSGQSSQVAMSCRARIRVNFFERVATDPFARETSVEEPTER